MGNIKNSTLLDPMALDYLEHPFCNYNRNYLFSEYSGILGKIVRKFFPFSFKFCRAVFSGKTSIVQLLNIAGKKIAPVYDLVKMVNVKEHCYNAQTLFKNILSITKSRYYLIFEDKRLENSEIKRRLLIAMTQPIP